MYNSTLLIDKMSLFANNTQMKAESQIALLLARHFQVLNPGIV